MDALPLLFVLTCFISLLISSSILFGGIIAVAIYQIAQTRERARHDAAINRDDNWGNLNRHDVYHQPKQHIEISRN